MNFHLVIDRDKSQSGNIPVLQKTETVQLWCVFFFFLKVNFILFIMKLFPDKA